MNKDELEKQLNKVIKLTEPDQLISILYFSADNSFQIIKCKEKEDLFSSDQYDLVAEINQGKLLYNNINQNNQFDQLIKEFSKQPLSIQMSQLKDYAPELLNDIIKHAKSLKKENKKAK